MKQKMAVMISALILMAFAAAPAASAKPSHLITIYPLGDSITFGWSRVAPHNQIPGGYRSPLCAMLIRAGYRVHFVGSNTGNPTPLLQRLHDTQHDGWPGWRIDQIAANVKGWLARCGYEFKGPAHPNIILLHIGTNDIIQHYDPEHPHRHESESQFMRDMESRMTALVQQLVHLRPGAHLLIAQVIPLGSWTPRLNGSKWNHEVRLFNHFIVAKLVPDCRVKGEHVRSVNQYANFSTPSGKPIWKHLPDKCHPDPYGYRLMAKTWFKAIVQLESHRHNR